MSGLRPLAAAGLACAAAAAAVAPASGMAAGAGTAGSPARLLVTATEFRLGLSRATVTAGPAIVQLANRGQDGHDLVLRRLDARGRESGPRRALPETAAGGLATRALTLPPGRYVLFCSLPGHRALGMHARLRVRR